MGFEDYAVALRPSEASPFYSKTTIEGINKFKEELVYRWPDIGNDDVALEYLMYPKKATEAYLCYKRETFLFQLHLSIAYHSNSTMHISMRFAYSNPRTVYQPFIDVLEWIMRSYHFECYPMRDLATDVEHISPIKLTKDLEAILIPSMDYNRRLWQTDAQTEEEAPLRPEEAINQFILPLTQEIPTDHG